jgi:hypothetical protein
VAQTQHHVAEDDAEGADEQQYAEVASVIDGSRHAADDEHAEGLDGADPADVGGAGLEELAALVVGLVYTCRPSVSEALSFMAIMVAHQTYSKSPKY